MRAEDIMWVEFTPKTKAMLARNPYPGLLSPILHARKVFSHASWVAAQRR
jgi:hypothetical protein